MMELAPLPELMRRVKPLFWPGAAPLDPKPTADEIEAAREILAEADPWTRMAYARWYPGYFRALMPDPLPPVLRD